MRGLWGLTINSGRGATLKYLYDSRKSQKNKMAALLGRKVIISASKLLRKAWLGSKLGDSDYLDLEYPIFDLKHGFLSSIEAEIISFCQRRQPFAFSAFYVHPLTFEGGSPFIFDK